MTVKKLLRTAHRLLTKPEFSILIPLDGSEKPDVVEKTLRSALNQSLRNIEVVVAHMSAGQDTIERLEFLRGRDTRIRLRRVSRSHDDQYATVLSEAASIARGRYMLPLHCPARLTKGILDTIRDRAASDRTDLV
ncbi:glycosyltransferase family A protein, partial [Actinomyces mediterranea]|uniref:glycosyltransferase family A protein n=1 Tax=Actinomyces mediterranea TaxID=1871028 RepID=UPI001967454B